MQSWMVTTRAAARRRRQHVVRLVQQMRALAREAERNPDLFAERIRPARLRRRRGSSAPSSLATSTSRGPAQDDVLGLLIEPREAKQDVADVGADAEVVELPRVNGDSHQVDAPRSVYCIGVGIMSSSDRLFARQRRYSAAPAPSAG